MEKGTFTDERDGKVYKTVKIGNQVWMAENLNCKIGNSWCYDDKNFQKYGRFYDWNTAMTYCRPKGWHLPTDAEWENLVNFVGGSEVAGKVLKSSIGWADNGNGEDKFGSAGRQRSFRWQFQLCRQYWHLVECHRARCFPCIQLGYVLQRCHCGQGLLR